MKDKPFRVLIVEDNPGDARLISEFLDEGRGSYEYEIAGDLATALILLASYPFDIILLDLGLPQSKGLDTFLNVHDAAPGMAIIVLTGLVNEELAHEALRRGAEDYLIKDTLNSPVLDQSVRYAIERQKARFELVRQHDLLREYLDLSATIFVVINPDRTIELINRKGCEILGYEEEELLGKDWIDKLIPRDIVDEVKGVFEQLKAGEVELAEFYQNPVVTRSGDTRLVAWHSSVLRGESGEITGIVSSGTDITEREQAEEALSASESRFRAVAQSAMDAIISANDKGDIIFWNDAAGKMFGYSPGEVLGKHLTMIMPERFHSVFEESYSRSTTSQTPPQRGPHMEAIGLRKDGVEIPIELSISGWQLEGKTFFTAIIRDISRRKAAESERRLVTEEAALINRLNDAANRGVSLDDIFRLAASETRNLFSSFGAMAYMLSDDRNYLILQKSMLPSTMYGVEKIIGISPERLELKIDLSDQGIYHEILTTRRSFITNNTETIQEMMTEFKAGKTIKKMIPAVQRLMNIQSVMTVPLVYQDQAIGLLDVSGQLPYSEADLERMERVATQLSSIIGRRMLEDQLTEQSELLRENNEELLALYEVSTAIGKESSMKDLLNRAVEVISSIRLFDIKKKAGIILVDGDDMKLTAFNGSGHSDEFVDLHKGMKVGRCLCGLAAKTGEIVISNNSDKDERHTIRYKGMQPHGHVIVPLKAQDRVAGVLYLYTPADVEIGERKINLLNNLGGQLGIAIERAKLYEETRTLSLHDPLTGLANRNLMNIELDRSFAMARRFQRPFSVIMLDLDHFKQYNDTYGHTAGDNLLTDVARITQEQVREIDLVVRFGGEEFLLILPDTDMDAARDVAERIRKEIANTGFFYSNEQPPTNITVSLGVAIYEDGLETPDTLITRADNALYTAKFKGRNRVEVSPAADSNTVSNHQ